MSAAPATAEQARAPLAAGYRHGLALALLGAVFAAWLLALAVALAAAVLPDEADGTVAVVFPPGTPEARMFRAVHGAGGALLRDTSLRTAWIVHGATPGFAGRLRERGAWQVFAPVAFEMVMLPGCAPGLVLAAGS